MNQIRLGPGLRGFVMSTVVLAAACIPVNLTPYRELTFPPTTEVEVLQAEPSQPYEVLGEMWMPANDTKGVLKMRQKAMEIGAHAIILLGDRNAGAVAIPLQGVGVVAVPVNRTYALAIRYER